jgi:hypothetical protein
LTVKGAHFAVEEYEIGCAFHRLSLRLVLLRTESRSSGAEAGKHGAAIRLARHDRISSPCLIYSGSGLCGLAGFAGVP